MKRRLLILGLGIVFLFAITWLGTFFGDYVLHRSTPQVQTSRVGPYEVTLHLDPDSPAPAQAATLTIQVQQSTTHQPVTNAHIVVDCTMENMDMGTTQAEAQNRGQGTYVAHTSFAMSGTWQIQVLVTTPDQPVLNAVFVLSN